MNKMLLNIQFIKINTLMKKIQQLIIYYFCGLYKRIGQHNDFLMARGLAFSFLICLMPTILLIFSVMGFVFRNKQVEEKINVFLFQVIPVKESVFYIKQFIHQRIQEFTIHKTVSALVGIIGLLWAASGLFSNIGNILNRVFDFHNMKNIMLSKLKDLYIVLFVLLFIILIMTILPLFEIVKQLAGRTRFLQVFQLGFIHNIIIELITFITVFWILCLVYYLIPAQRLRKQVILVTSIWTTMLWGIAQKGFVFSITHSITITKIYGTYVLGVIIVFWIYYSAFIFILGAEIGQLYRQHPNYHSNMIGE